MIRHDFQLKDTVASRSQAAGRLNKPGESLLVERGVPRLLLMKCPCGCGDEIPINLDARAGQAWRFYVRRGRASLFPSVWRDTGCGAHFIVWNNRIYLFSTDEDGLSDQDDMSDALRSNVLRQLSPTRWAHYEDVAGELDEIPWDVLFACRSLVRRRVVEEGKGHHRGSFRRRED